MQRRGLLIIELLEVAVEDDVRAIPEQCARATDGGREADGEQEALVDA